MYIANDSLESNTEKNNLETLKKQMQEAGLYVPEEGVEIPDGGKLVTLVIFDRYSIKEKMKKDMNKDLSDEEL